MLYAIFSDIHANESALRRALDDARDAGAERFVCLGDIVGYGPMPAETLRLVRNTCKTVVAGNHDDAVSGRMPADDFIDLAAEAVVRHQRAISKEELNWLQNLPYSAEIEGACVVHGDLVDGPAFNYIDNEHSAAENFSRMPGTLLFCGHTHVPLIHAMSPDGDITVHAPVDFSLTPNYHYIVNPGSIGYPREADGRCESTYVLYDSAARTIRYRRLPFAVSSVMQRGADQPKPSRRLPNAAIIGMAVACVAVTVGVASIAMLHETLSAESHETAAEPIEKALETRELAIPTLHRKITPNLQLASGSAPVNLRVTFFDANGTIIFRDEDPVKKSRRGNIPVPDKATSVRLELLRIPAEDAPSIHSFAPFTL